MYRYGNSFFLPITNVINISNSDGSFSEDVTSDTVLEDITFRVYVDAVLDQQFDYPSIKDLTINIAP